MSWACSSPSDNVLGSGEAGKWEAGLFVPGCGLFPPYSGILMIRGLLWLPQFEAWVNLRHLRVPLGLSQLHSPVDLADQR